MARLNFTEKVKEAEPGEGPIYRSSVNPTTLSIDPAKGVKTLYDVMEYAATHNTTRNGFGYRTLTDTIKETKQITKIVDGVETTQDKTWTYFQLSEPQHITYGEAFETVKHIGSGLAHLGFKPEDKIQISASTSHEWTFVAYGSFSQSMTVVTAYDTLGPEGLKHSINESEARVCFMNSDQLPLFSKILDGCPTLTTILYRGQPSPDVLSSVQSRIRVLSYNELLELGQANPASPIPPSPQQLCCIMYTSGSTGNPKGVMITHANIVGGIGGVSGVCSKFLRRGDNTVAYLPLAHVFEFIVESCCIFLGVTLQYGSIRTLTNASVRGCMGDLQAYRPTVLIGVPQVWETIKKSIVSTVSQKSPRVQKVFQNAVEWKKYLNMKGLPSGFLNQVVFGAVKKQVGGRLRYCISAGAPISPATQEFLSLILCPILVAYGMTESCGMCTLMEPSQWATSEVGGIVPCCEVKLVDRPEMGYVSNRDDGGRPQGEVWIRGPSITSGYYKRPDATQESFPGDGWLNTGDIGEWTERGTLSIIDRVKNLVKLSNGEYIALEKIESIYKSCPILENVCVYADPLYTKPVAVVVPLVKAFTDFLTERGLLKEGQVWDEVSEEKEVKDAVLKFVKEHAAQNGLKGTEIIGDLWVCNEEWTVEKDLLTAAQKIKRKTIHTNYKAKIDVMLVNITQ